MAYKTILNKKNYKLIVIYWIHEAFYRSVASSYWYTSKILSHFIGMGLGYN